MMKKWSPEPGQLEVTLQKTNSRPAAACPVCRMKLVIVLTTGICFLMSHDPYSTAAVVKERLLIAN